MADYFANETSIADDGVQTLKTRRICVLSYQAPHKKTMDTLLGLLCAGYHNLCVYALPLHYTKTYHPLVEHRPEFFLPDDGAELDANRLISNLGVSCRNITSYEEIEEPKNTVFLVCGAGILPQSFIQRYRIINAHPGYLPMVRGLDALKWAVLEHKPIGVTTHLLGEFVDAGAIIERCEVPITQQDTFHTVVYRQYQMEIQMLIRAIDKADRTAFFTDGEGYPVHRRMPHDLEQKLYQEFAQQYNSKVEEKC